MTAYYYYLLFFFVLEVIPICEEHMVFQEDCVTCKKGQPKTRRDLLTQANTISSMGKLSNTNKKYDDLKKYKRKIKRLKKEHERNIKEHTKKIDLLMQLYQDLATRDALRKTLGNSLYNIIKDKVYFGE